MPNPEGSGVLFLGCQHPKIQGILLFTYPEPPHVGQLRASLPPEPSAGIWNSDTSPCKTRPEAPAAQPAQSTSNTYQQAPAPYSTVLRSLFQDRTAGRRCPSLSHRSLQRASGTWEMRPPSHSSDLMQLLSQQPPSSSRVGEREPAANAYHRLPHHVLSC